MANSTRGSISNFDPHFFRVPARSPGPLGINDQGDPSLTSVLGDTPGPLGINDHAAPVRSHLLDLHVIGASYFAQDGTPMTHGICNDPPAVSTGMDNAAKNITSAVLIAAEPKNSMEYYDSIIDILNLYAASYSITTPLRVAHFISQVAHESALRTVEEKGHYSARRMRQVFGCKGGARNYDSVVDDARRGRLRDKLWNEENKYANNPENLLNYVYASRLGNGDEESGDGFRYRGRGMMQLTGKANYAAFTAVHNQHDPGDKRDFVATPDLLATRQYGIESAFYFWESRHLNKLADIDDLAQVTLRINGGYNGLDDRTARLKRVKHVLGI